MGRYYKGPTGQEYLDYLYKLPQEQMLEGVKMHSGNIDDTLSEISETQKLLEVQNLKGDNEFVNKRLGYYDDKFNNISNDILKDVMSYRKRTPDIRGLSRELEKDLSRGGLGRAQEMYDKFDKYKTEVKANKDLSEDRKRRLIEASEQDYNNLSFASEDDYNDIDRHLITGFKHIDEDEYLTGLASGWEAEQSMWASAEVESDGRVRTKKGTNKKREEADVENYLNKSLAASGWLDDNLQELELMQKLGEFEGDIGQEMERRRKELIEKGKIKLGFSQRQGSETLSSLPAGSGGTGGDARATPGTEVKDNIGSREERLKTEALNNKIEKQIVSGTIKGYETPEKLVEAAFGENNQNFTKVLKNLQDQGLYQTEDEVRGLLKWVNTKDLQNQKYEPIEENINNSGETIKPSTIISVYNNRDLNSPVENIYYRNSKNELVKLSDYNTLGELKEDNREDADTLGKGQNFIWLPITSSSKSEKPTYKVNNNGYVINKVGAPILDDDDNPITPKMLEENNYGPGVTEDVVVNYKDMPSYKHKGNNFKGNKHTLKEIKTRTVDVLGRVTIKKSYRHVLQVYKIPVGGGKEEQVTMEIEVKPEDINQ
jgi:hypothetical protein